MKTRPVVVVLTVLGVLAAPWIAAADTAGAGAAEPAVRSAAGPAAEPASAASPAPATAAPAVEPPLEPLFLTDGCTAEQHCIHTPPVSVSCSAPSGGICSSSWQGCGRVTCNGVTTKCPGTCVGDHHCFNFCMDFYNSFDGFCDSGCCECL